MKWPRLIGCRPRVAPKRPRTPRFSGCLCAGGNALLRRIPHGWRAQALRPAMQGLGIRRELGHSGASANRSSWGATLRLARLTCAPITGSAAISPLLDLPAFEGDLHQTVPVRQMPRARRRLREAFRRRALEVIAGPLARNSSPSNSPRSSVPRPAAPVICCSLKLAALGAFRASQTRSASITPSRFDSALRLR